MGQWEKEGRVTPFVNWRMETFDEAESKNNGRSIFMRTPVAGKGAFRLQDLYRAATSTPLTGDFDTDTLLSKEVEVTVTDGAYGPEVKTIRAIK